MVHVFVELKSDAGTGEARGVVRGIGECYKWWFRVDRAAFGRTLTGAGEEKG
jgi:hypothetical protein